MSSIFLTVLYRTQTTKFFTKTWHIYCAAILVRASKEGRMRVVTFRGAAVKRQRKIGDDKILLSFYSRPPIVVSCSEWEAEKQNIYYEAGVRRRDVVRK